MSISLEEDGHVRTRIAADAGGTSTDVLVPPNNALHLWAESDFVVFLVTRNQPEGAMIAPRNANARRWVLGPSALPATLRLVSTGMLEWYLIPTAPVVEVPDPNPVENPAAGKRPLSLQEEMQRFIRREMSRQAQEQGQETFEESDDFDVEEESDPLSQYQLSEMQKEEPVKRPAKAPGKAPTAVGASGAGGPTSPPEKSPKEAEDHS